MGSHTHTKHSAVPSGTHAPNLVCSGLLRGCNFGSLTSFRNIYLYITNLSYILVTSSHFNIISSPTPATVTVPVRFSNMCLYLTSLLSNVPSRRPSKTPQLPVASICHKTKAWHYRFTRSVSACAARDVVLPRRPISPQTDSSRGTNGRTQLNWLIGSGERRGRSA
jgi:hypothetical protein